MASSTYRGRSPHRDLSVGFLRHSDRRRFADCPEGVRTPSLQVVSNAVKVFGAHLLVPGAQSKRVGKVRRDSPNSVKITVVSV